MAHAVSISHVRERTAIARELTVETRQIGEAIGQALGEEYAYIGAQGLRPTGAPFVVYHDRLPDDRWAIEVCAPVAEGPAVPPQGDLKIERVAGGTVANTIHRGPYQTIGTAYEDIARWIGEHEFVVAGPAREIYLSDPGAVPPEQLETLVEMPVEALTAAD